MKKKIGEFILVAFIILLAIFVIKDIDFREVYNIFLGMKWRYFFIAVFLYLFYFLAWNLRLNLSLSEIFPISFGYSLIVLLAGSFFNTVTPGAAVGGEPVRAYFLHKKYKKPVSKIFGAIVADKFFHTAALLVFTLIAIISVLALFPVPYKLKIFFWGLLFLLFMLISIALFVALKKVKFDLLRLLKKFYYFKFVQKYFVDKEDFEKYLHLNFRKFVKILKKIAFSSKKMIFIKGSLSILLWIAILFISYCLFLALGVSVNFFIVFAVVFIGQIIADLSPIPGGIGLTESSSFLIYSLLGVAPEAALIVSLFERIIYYFYTLGIGGSCLIYLRLVSVRTTPSETILEEGFQGSSL